MRTGRFINTLRWVHWMWWLRLVVAAAVMTYGCMQRSQTLLLHFSTKLVRVCVSATWIKIMMFLSHTVGNISQMLVCGLLLTGKSTWGTSVLKTFPCCSFATPQSSVAFSADVLRLIAFRFANRLHSQTQKKDSKWIQIHSLVFANEKKIGYGSSRYGHENEAGILFGKKTHYKKTCVRKMMRTFLLHINNFRSGEIF